MDEVLVASDIYANYGRREVLRGACISLWPSEIVSIVGPNGAGKSTLLKVIAGALQPKSGRVVLESSDVSDLAQFERARRGICYLMQGGPVFSNLTVEENLNLAHTLGKKKRSEIDRETILEFFPSLAAVYGRRAGLLSGGQRQLLAIAMIVEGVQHKRVLLLDEPLAGLSHDIAQRVLLALQRIREEAGASILLVEQNLRAAIELSDRICVLKSGILTMEESAGTINIHRIEEAYFS